MKLNYMIVDDEPLMHQIIEKYCEDLDYMTLVANCYNAIEALNILNVKDVDLIFLDINMPKLKGFDFLRTLKKPIKIIVVTAHKEYALEGYELNITDYLLKPFSLERFLQSLQKLQQSFTQTLNAMQHIFIKDEKKHHQVNLNDILYIEASGNYTITHLNDQRIISQMSMTEFERLLPESTFIRVHRSFIVSKLKINVIESTELKNW